MNKVKMGNAKYVYGDCNDEIKSLSQILDDAEKSTNPYSELLDLQNQLRKRWIFLT